MHKPGLILKFSVRFYYFAPSVSYAWHLRRTEFRGKDIKKLILGTVFYH